MEVLSAFISVAKIRKSESTIQEKNVPTKNYEPLAPGQSETVLFRLKDINVFADYVYCIDIYPRPNGVT